ncbi:MAG: fused MFS/spermidine synthase [Gammaproteobacteria bacterium]|nr:fused MFS/spermidine synthase [Gammaproteobacteria bacterium]
MSLSLSMPRNLVGDTSRNESSIKRITLFSGKEKVNLYEVPDALDLHVYKVKRLVYQRQTAYQHITIADTYNYGRVLMLDGAVQSAQSDEALYHELLVQPAMLRHPDPKDVLIIGGGEGASLREVLAHRSVRTATMVDIDGEVVESCRKYLPTWHCGAFDDARARVFYADGRKFIEEHDGKYDVVIIDVVDMLDNGPAQALYTQQFYKFLRRRLHPGFIVAIQGLEFTFSDSREHAALVRTLRTVFPYVHSYSATIPSFLSSWGFVVACDDYPPNSWRANEIDSAISRKLAPDRLVHLDGAYLEKTFTHCRLTRQLLAMPGPILEDEIKLEFNVKQDITDEMAGATKAQFKPLR